MFSLSLLKTRTTHKWFSSLEYPLPMHCQLPPSLILSCECLCAIFVVTWESLYIHLFKSWVPAHKSSSIKCFQLVSHFCMTYTICICISIFMNVIVTLRLFMITLIHENTCHQFRGGCRVVFLLRGGGGHNKFEPRKKKSSSKNRSPYFISKRTDWK